MKPIDVSDFERPQLEIHKEGEEHDTLEGEDNYSISNSECGPNTNPHTKTDLTTYQLIRDRTRKQTKPNSKNTRKMSLADQKLVTNGPLSATKTNPPNRKYWMTAGRQNQAS